MIEEGQSGSLVRPDDPEDLARALTPLLHDAALRERYGTRGRSRYEEQFSVEKMARRTEALYLEGTGGGGK
jgi:glycosyltransferase involved in cell wall biosynthesis